jgi:hypothetical protein
VTEDMFVGDEEEDPSADEDLAPSSYTSNPSDLLRRLRGNAHTFSFTFTLLFLVIVTSSRSRKLSCSLSFSFPILSYNFATGTFSGFLDAYLIKKKVIGFVMRNVSAFFFFFCLCVYQYYLYRYLYLNQCKSDDEDLFLIPDHVLI